MNIQPDHNLSAPHHAQNSADDESLFAVGPSHDQVVPNATTAQVEPVPPAISNSNLLDDQTERPVNDEAGCVELDSAKTAEGLKRDGFAASVYLLVVLTILQKGLGFVRSIVICRHLEPSQLGLWSMTLTFMETFVPLLILSIPACFGRYFEYYEKQGQLKSFIKQSIVLIGICFPLGVALLAIFREPLSQVIYGGVEHAPMLLTSLFVVIPFGVFGVLASMLTGLRKSQARTIGEFVNGTSFTVLAITLVVFGNASAFTIAYAFAGSYAIATLFSLFCVRRIYRSLERSPQALCWRGTWRKLAPIIFIFWLTDFLTNLFFTVDRYMIINFSTSHFGEPLNQVGNYEAAHVMPLLFSSFMAIIAKLLLPYLSRDWEAGHCKRVGTKINLSVKVGGLVLVLGSTGFLWVSDYLFDFLFKGKYAAGQEVLPFIVFFYVGSGMSFLLLNYFWCCEKGKFAILALTCGLVVNIAINAVLIQTYGIMGAAIGTASAVATQFLVLLISASRSGLQFDWRILIVFGTSLVLLLSPHLAIAASALLVVLFAAGLLFNKDERELILHRS